MISAIKMRRRENIFHPLTEHATYESIYLDMERWPSHIPWLATFK